MWYPEEPITYCPECDLDLPAFGFWRSRGTIISSCGRPQPTVVLNSLCPSCGARFRVGLDGPLIHRWIHACLWWIRYPSRKRPRPNPEAVAGTAEEAAEPDRRRAVG